jgi:salicylate hydroxylase
VWFIDNLFHFFCLLSFLSILHQLEHENPNPMAASKKNFHVAVIGGGIAGVTLAITLHHRNIPVTLYEQAPAFGEVGAGVSFGPNAVAAMKACHQGIFEAFEKVCTRNMWSSKQNVWFDYLDGHSTGTSTSAQNSSHQDIAFTISNSTGQTGVHRAHFLDELIKLVPGGISRFNKRLDDVTEREDGKLVLKFADGSEDVTDVVIGCDGIKSRVRQLMVGEDHPSANPTYTHKYAYRGLIPMDKAIGAIGEELASNSCMHVSLTEEFD